MEAILFYGDQDEATRRQVRSVAAQYSHRIGPRKRKKSRLPKETGVIESKRGHYKKLAATAPEVAASSSKAKPGQQRFKLVFDPQQAHVDVQARPTLEGQQQGQRAHGLRRELSNPETCAPSSETGSEPSHSPHTPPLGFSGIAQSPEKPHSAYRRLPAYTWTEYPRYAVTEVSSPTSSNVLPSVAAAKRPTLQLPDPTSCLRGLRLSDSAKQIPPRSHPMIKSLEPQQPRVNGLDADPFLSGTLKPTSTAEVTKEPIPSSQPASQPPLRILRCATEEDSASSDDASRWRSGREYFTVEEKSPSTSPG